MKLFTDLNKRQTVKNIVQENHKDSTVIDYSYKEVLSLENSNDNIDKYIIAFEDISSLHTALIGDKQYVNPSNIDLFNRYVDRYYRDLNLPREEEVYTAEDFKTLSMEGVVGGVFRGIGAFFRKIWEAIKKAIMKVVDAIKNFYKRYFTKEGSVNRKLDNIIETLEGGNYKLNAEAFEENGNDKTYKFANKIFASDDKITPNLVQGFINDCNYQFLGKLVSMSTKFIQDPNKLKAYKTSLDKLQKLKKAREKAQGKVDEIKNKGAIDRIKSSFNGETKEAKNNLKEVQKEIKENEKVVNEDKSGTQGMEDSDQTDAILAIYAKDSEKFTQEYAKTVIDPIKQRNGFRLAYGKRIILKKDSNEYELDLDMEEIGEFSEDPVEIDLLEPKEAIMLSRKIKDAISSTKGISDSYNNFLGAIDNSISQQDKFISDMEKSLENISDEYKDSVNRVKKEIDLWLKPQAKAIKLAVVTTSKLISSLFDNTLNVGEGVIEYCVLSMKYYEKF